MACQPEPRGVQESAPPARRYATAPAGSVCVTERRLESLTFVSWNQHDGWLRRVDGLRQVPNQSPPLSRLDEIALAVRLTCL
jgi:hypothetical protein